MSTEAAKFTWGDVQALLTEEDRRRVEEGSAPDLATDVGGNGSDTAVPPAGGQNTGPASAGGGLFARARERAAAKANKARQDVAQSFGDLLTAPGLPRAQREILITLAYAIYRTIRGTTDREALKRLLPRVEEIIAAGLEESTRAAVADPGMFATPDDVDAMSEKVSAHTFTVLHTIHAAHLTWEAYAALASGGGSLAALPLTMSIHTFLVGTVATVMAGLAEMYGCASYITNLGVSEPATATLALISSTTSTLEDAAMVSDAVRDWTSTPTEPARQIARRWLAKSGGTGLPILGKKLHEERRGAILDALRELKRAEDELSLGGATPQEDPGY